MASAPKHRLAAIDWLKVVALIAVVITHAGPAKRWPSYGEWDAILRTRWVSFHVPIFLMVSGFLYYAPRAIAAREVGRRWVRILVPYTVASGVVYASGLIEFRDLEDLLTRWATGSTLHIYYYVFLIVVYTPLIWILSRVDRRAVVVLWCVLAVATYVAARTLAPSPFWATRSPINFSLLQFLTGWLVAAWLPELRAWVARFRVPVALVALAIIGAYLFVSYEPLLSGSSLPMSMQSRARFVTMRTGYAFAVAGLIVLAVGASHTPRVVRFLSDGTFAIYLYHRIILWAILPFLIDLPSAARVPVLAIVSIALSCAGLWIAQRLLGSRSRLIFGG